MIGSMTAEIKDGKIFLTEIDKKTRRMRHFQLIPFQETKDGLQEINNAAVDDQLARIAACLNDFNGVPTEVIEQGFVGRAMKLIEQGRESAALLKDVLERADEKAKAQELQALPAENPGQQENDSVRESSQIGDPGDDSGQGGVH